MGLLSVYAGEGEASVIVGCVHAVVGILRSLAWQRRQAGRSLKCVDLDRYANLIETNNSFLRTRIRTELHSDEWFSLVGSAREPPPSTEQIYRHIVG